MIRLEFAWPSKQLTSNARGHWSRRHKASKEVRTAAYWVAKGAGVGKWPLARLRVYFAPPDNRRRDPSNAPILAKSIIDGLADAMGCDDHGFWVEYQPDFLPKVEGGKIIIEVEGDGE